MLLLAELDTIPHLQANAFAKLFGAIKVLQESSDASQMIDSALQAATEQYGEMTKALHQLHKQIADQAIDTK